MPVERKKTRAGFKWRYRGQYRGVLYHSQLIYPTKQEADRDERLKRIEIDELARNPNKITLYDLMAERLDLLALKKSRKYYLDNRYYFQRLLKYLGNGDIAEITRKQVNCFINDFAKDLAERGRGNYRVNNCITCLKALFNYGIRIYDLGIKNPVCGIEKFAEEVKIKYIPTDEDIEQVLGLCDSDESLLVRFLMDTGARINEALALNPKDIYDGYVVLYTRKSRYSNLIPRKVPYNT